MSVDIEVKAVALQLDFNKMWSFLPSIGNLVICCLNLIC